MSAIDAEHTLSVSAKVLRVARAHYREGNNDFSRFVFRKTDVKKTRIIGVIIVPPPFLLSEMCVKMEVLG